MQVLQVATAAAVVAAMALAGCSAGPGASGFSIKQSDGTYTFTASASADNYTWDLGDHLTRAYTKSVTHKYDFANGVVPVTLVTTKGEQRAEHRKEITLGTGINQNAGFVLEGGSNWTVLGETVSLSANRSSDPDGDPLRFTWSCQRVSDAVRGAAHGGHGGGAAAPFATPPAGSVLSVNAQGPLPAADRIVAGDLCDGLGQAGRPTRDATIAGAFTRGGVYDVYLLASDPVHPTTSGKYRIVVTPPAEKPPNVLTQPFTGTFLAGSGGAVQEVCDLPQPCARSFDQGSWTMGVPLPAQAAWLALAYEDPTQQMQITCVLTRGGTEVGRITAPGNATLDPAAVTAASYAIDCAPAAAAPLDPEGTQYTVTFGADLYIDPFIVYDA